MKLPRFLAARLAYDGNTYWSWLTAPGTISNGKGRLTEAETDNCTGNPGTEITDEWFSYDADGNLTDVYEKTPNSGGYYHTTSSYWANGGLETLGLLNSAQTALVPLQTYGADGEGRPNSVTAAGQSPVTGVTYTTSGTAEPIGSLTQVTFGSLDSDSYQYDTNTGRMKQYSFNVNGQSAVGKLYWNPNGTLQQLASTDPFNTQDNQTCNYLYDDLARLGGKDANGYSVDCGSSTWAQEFTYDAFGNITKSGSISWLPGYNSATNQYTTPSNCSTTGGVPCYDANGSLLKDTFNTYTWDAYGDLASVNGATATYDAFGRMVENHGGAYQYAYSPGGQHPLAQMQGQVPTNVYVPLPGGAVAVYNSSGTLFQYNHGDWIGSAKLFSTPGRTAIPAMSYAPFGEGYAGGQQWIQFTGTGEAWTVADNENQSGSLEDFTFRRYSPVQGRWISPDPAGRSAVNPMNPQSWNRYVYTGNNPLSNLDPLGLQDCTMDGVDSTCDMVFALLNSPAPGAVQCPNNQCNGYTNNGTYVNFYAFAGGAQGYYAPGAIGAGVYEQNGKIYSDSGWQGYLAQTYANQIAAQYGGVLGNLNALFGGTVTANPDDPNIQGGHANFALDCGIGPCPPVGRYDDGIHIECAAGGYNCSSDAPLVVHDDTVSPWISPFSFSNFSPINFLEHGFVDLFGGTLCNCVFSQ